VPSRARGGQIRTGDEAARLQVEPGLLDADTIAVGRGGADADGAPGESVDEYILRRTKEYNVSTRERPYDLSVWLQFAAFQVIKPYKYRRRGRERLGGASGYTWVSSTAAPAFVVCKRHVLGVPSSIHAPHLGYC